jgi:hypothetical protein
VLPGTGTERLPGFNLAGAAVTAGEAVYVAADGTIKPAKSNTATAPVADTTYPPEAGAVGIALNSAALGQPVVVQSAGPVALGVATVPGMVYVVSAANAGGIAPFADLATAQTPPDFVSILGWGSQDGTQLILAITITGVSR